MAVPPTSVPPPIPGPPMPPPAPTGAAKADLGKRFIAALIDGLLCGVVSFIPVLGGLVAGVYMLIRDGLELEFMDRRSIGKKVMKLRPVQLDGQPMDIGASVKRNITFVVGFLGLPFLVIPLLGWILALLLGICGMILGLIEIVMVLTDSEGRRMGDKIAGTKVIEVAQ
jgi:uncharacterized RDD family membrane protein YckC